MKKTLWILVLLLSTVLVGCGGTTKGTQSLLSPEKKEIAMKLVSSAENSSLDWQVQYEYIEDIHDGHGFTADIIGFCSGTGDMLALIEDYTKKAPNNSYEACT